MQAFNHSSTPNSTRVLVFASALLIFFAFFTVLLVWNPFSRDCLPTLPAQQSTTGNSVIELHKLETHQEAQLPPPSETAASLTHLILVAGHAVLTSLDVHDLTSPSNWELLDYQRSQVATFVAHIERGVDMARADPSALLIFSGGETRRAAGPRSEAQSYWTAAEHAKWFLKGPAAAAEAASETTSTTTAVRTVDEVSTRATTEEYARDSFENLLFSLVRFHEFTGRWPQKISVVGFSFKENRFTQLHRSAIRWPLDQFHYEGVDPPLEADDSSDEEDAKSAALKQEEQDAGASLIADRIMPTVDAATTTSDTQGTVARVSARMKKSRAARLKLMEAEQTQSFLPFLRDPYSCEGILAKKKFARNPFRRHHAYTLSVGADVRGLLEYCGGDIYPGALPWDSNNDELRSASDVLQSLKSELLEDDASGTRRVMPKLQKLQN